MSEFHAHKRCQLWCFFVVLEFGWGGAFLKYLYEQAEQWHEHPHVVVLPVSPKVNCVQQHQGGRAYITVRLQFWSSGLGCKWGNK